MIGRFYKIFNLKKIVEDRNVFNKKNISMD